MPEQNTQDSNQTETVRITVDVPAQVKADIDEYCARNGIKKNWFIVHSLKAGLSVATTPKGRKQQ